MKRFCLIGLLLVSEAAVALSAQSGTPDTRRATASIAITPRDDYEQWKDALALGVATSPASFTVLPGFTVEMLRSAQPDEGSWIAVTLDPKGRIIIAREKRGLLRLTPSGEGLRVEVVEDTLEEVRGLLYAFDSLYANAKASRGLFRLFPNASESAYEVRPLVKTTGGGGHGRNGLALSPNGSIGLIHGDSVDLPPGVERLTPPVVPGLFPADDRPRGHFLRTDPEGRQFTLVTSGLRNPVGVDFNPEGEAFTYDADAETDMGTPWYRPTHVRHLVSGADYGWRLVTGRWPPYYPDQVDNPPSTLVIGKGSPTAVRFGTRSHFPPDYKRALFILDWTYGRIMAIHLTPQGASYTARAETFLRGRPLNVTGLDFGPDGMMYFVTGGRGTQSALYRVRYTGPEVGASPVSGDEAMRVKSAAEARALRRSLETFHGRRDSTVVESAWGHLDHPDPWIAHAARIALEHQPAAEWARRALEEPTISRALPALMSLTRVGPDDYLAAVLDRLTRIPPSLLTSHQKLVFVRTAEFATQRLGTFGDVPKETLVRHVDALVPDPAPEVTRKAAALLLALSARTSVPKVVSLLAAATTQEDKLHYLQLLSRAREGWEDEDRGRFFRVLAQAPSFRGGAGLPKYIKQIEQDALQAIPETERSRFAAMLSQKKTPLAALPPVTARPFVKAWTMDDLEPSLSDASKARNLQRGRTVYAAATCIVCHQLGDEGNAVGPDLTDVASRFNRRDLLDSILQPSRVVSETYRTIVVTTKQGETMTGRLALADYRLPVLRLAVNPLDPDEVVEVKKTEIATYGESEVSLMPHGLLDWFQKDEILDLLAYIEAGGKS